MCVCACHVTAGSSTCWSGPTVSQQHFTDVVVSSGRKPTRNWKLWLHCNNDSTSDSIHSTVWTTRTHAHTHTVVWTMCTHLHSVLWTVLTHSCFTHLLSYLLVCRVRMAWWLCASHAECRHWTVCSVIAGADVLWADYSPHSEDVQVLPSMYVYVCPGAKNW